MTIQNEIIGYRRNGLPIRVIRGGSEAATTETDETPKGDAGETLALPKGNLASELRAGGVDALKADLAGERDKRQAIETQFSEFKAQFVTALSALTGQKPNGDESLTVEALAEKISAFQAEQSEKDKASQSKLVKAEVKAVATKLGFHNELDALSRLDLTNVPLVEGEVDSAYIESELNKIVTESPYLVKEFVASAQDVGIGGQGSKEAANLTGEQRIAQGYKNSKRK